MKRIETKGIEMIDDYRRYEDEVIGYLSVFAGVSRDVVPFIIPDVDDIWEFYLMRLHPIEAAEMLMPNNVQDSVLAF